MLKSLITIGVLVILNSCGQSTAKTDSKKLIDSSVKVERQANADTSTFQIDTTPKKPRAIEFHRSKTVSSSLTEFIPDNYSVLDTASGDLNLDAFPDMILILHKNGEDSTSNVIDHPEKRPLLILLGQPEQSYKLAARSDNAVYCIDCGGVMGDPYQNIVIKNGYFSIEHYGGSNWRWTRTITFKYSNADNYWFLHKDGGESFQATNPDKMTEKVRTTRDFGKVPFDKFDIYK
jgi:hypothetical protein